MALLPSAGRYRAVGCHGCHAGVGHSEGRNQKTPFQLFTFDFHEHLKRPFKVEVPKSKVGNLLENAKIGNHLGVLTIDF